MGTPICDNCVTSGETKLNVYTLYQHILYTYVTNMYLICTRCITILKVRKEIKEHIMSRYRVESGSVYEYSESHKAYLFIGKLNGLTKKQFITEYEDSLLYGD